MATDRQEIFLRLFPSPKPTLVEQRRIASREPEHEQGQLTKLLTDMHSLNALVYRPSASVSTGNLLYHQCTSRLEDLDTATAQQCVWGTRRMPNQPARLEK
eukprot:scpid21276/ scgid6762/ 